MIKKINLLLAFITLINAFSYANKEGDSDFHFTENKGQFGKSVEYLCKLHIGNIQFKKNSFTFDLYSAKELSAFYEYRHSKKDKGERPFDKLNKHVYNMNFLGANINSSIIPHEAQTSYKNYFLGNDPSRWASNVISYEKISYQNIYDGIDANIYSTDDHLKYDFIVAKGVNPNQIKIEYEGVEKLQLVNGVLEVILSNEIVKELKPIAFQEINGEKVNVPCDFVIKDGVVSFNFPKGYDHKKELIIDPTWVFSTLTGSSSDNWGFTATYDKDGAFYGGGVVFGGADFFDTGGYDNTASYPLTGGAYQTTFGGHVDIAITKFSANGTSLIYSTFIGGNDMEEPHSLVCDSSNNLIIMGAVGSTNFPTTIGAKQRIFGGGISLNNFDGIDWDNGSDIFVAKLNAAGNTLLASTYLGGSRNDGLSLDAQLNYNYGDHARGEVIIDANNNIYIASVTNSTNFPTTPLSYDQTGGGTTNYDAVACKLNPTLTTLNWGTYLGGTGGSEAGYSVRVDEVNNKTFICGGTESSGLATVGVLDNSYAGSVDGFVAKFDNLNGTLDAFTYLGNASYNQAFILEIDKFQDVYVFGQTIGTYPIFNATYSKANGAQFIQKMNNNLTTSIFSTTFGSGNSASRVDISPSAFLVDNCGNIYVSGWGDEYGANGSTDGMQVTANAIDGTTQGDDFYFAVIERDAQSLLYGTFFGINAAGQVGEHIDGGTSRFDKKGTIYQGVCGGCGGNSFPTTLGAYSSANGSTNCNYGAIKISLDFQGVIASAVQPPPISLCGAPFNVTFNAGTTPPPQAYWNFGDGVGTSSQLNPTYTYPDSGTYHVMYVAIDPASCNITDTAYFDVTIIKTGTMNASIDIPTYDPCTTGGLTVDYAFTGSGADSLYWNMGNGTTYIDSVSFSYTYNTPGTYYVEMQAFEFACGGYVSIRDTIDFNPTYTAVQAINMPNQSICNAPFDVNFDAIVTPPNTYWNFGDGATLGIASDYTPTHAYATPGTYSAYFVAIDSSTCNIVDTAFFNITVIQTGTMTASINIPPYNPCTTGGLTVGYSFTGSGADSLYWVMGDGTTYIDSVSFSYTYNTPGTYYPELHAFEFACGGFTIIKDTIDFNPTYTAVQAINMPNQSICNAPYNVSFDAIVTPPNTYWNFGDGSTLGIATDYTPTHAYASPGTYSAYFVAIDSSTCNIVDTAFFNITVIQPAPLAATIDIPPYNPCTTGGLTVDFNFTGSGADSLYWNMGNGTTYTDSTSFSYTYNTPGTYYVTFHAEEFSCGTNTTIIDTIDFNPTYTAVQAINMPNQSICNAPYNVSFNAIVTPPNTYWNFGDGATLGIASDYTPTHTYASPGTYSAYFVAIDSSTCNIVDTAFFNITVIQPAPLAATIDIPPYNPCTTGGLTVDFNFTGSGADSLYWNMGNGTTYTDSTSFSYTYNTPGTYYVTFHAEEFSCGTNTTIIDTIDFNPTYTAVQAINMPNQSICNAPYNVSFDAIVTPPNTYWNFGDGATLGIASDYTPTHTYASLGTYSAYFVAIDSSTCNIVDTAFFNITVFQPPVLNAQFNIPPYNPCQSSLTINTAFTGTGADSLYWNFGNGNTSNAFSTSNTYTSPGTYYLVLHAFDFQCNKDTIIRDTVFFTPVTTIVTAIAPAPINSCNGNLSVNFSSGNPAPPQNTWDFGDGNTSTSINPLHTYADTGSYNVIYTAIDSSSCNYSATATFNVTIHAVPQLQVNMNYTPPLPCEATNYLVELSAAALNSDSIYWDMGDGSTFIDSSSVSYEYATAGDYSIIVTLYNECGPKSFSYPAKFVEIGQTTGITPNVFTPNGDDWNDQLVFVGVDFTQDYSIKIFDRWGRSAYESTDATKNWDGKDASEGTYFYELRYTDVCSSVEKLKTGTVTLLRGPKK